MKKTHKLYSYNDMNIEFTIIGEGTPILAFHGGHSSCHEEFGYQKLVDNGFMIITPSRAGYGKTSKQIGTSLSTACHFYVQILNHLNIDKAHILAISAGGPTAIHFAAEYPERVSSLILQSAVTKEWLTPKDIEYKVALVMFRALIEKGTWKLVASLNNLFPKFLYKNMAQSFSTLSKAEIMARSTKTDIDQMKRMNNRQRAGHGFLIDLKQTGELSLKTLQAISCPTLIMHSLHDGSASIEHAYHAHQHISSTEFMPIDSWGHLIWLSETANLVNDKVSKFITENND